MKVRMGRAGQEWPLVIFLQYRREPAPSEWSNILSWNSDHCWRCWCASVRPYRGVVRLMYYAGQLGRSDVIIGRIACLEVTLDRCRVRNPVPYWVRRASKP